MIYVVLALVLRQTATVNIGLCEEHAAARRQHIVITWIMGLLSVASFGVAIVVEGATFAVIGCVLILATAIYGIIKCRVVVPAKIDQHFVWLNGINGNYLQEFPEWHGSR